MSAGDLTKIKAMEYFFSTPACGQLSASKIVQTLLVASDVYVGKDSRRTQRFNLSTSMYLLIKVHLLT